MRLTEFYALNEARSAHYTVEPDGSLLAWERVMYPEDELSDDETSYEVLTTREDDSFVKLAELLELSSNEVEEARDMWSQAAAEGDSLYASKDGGRLSLDIQLRANPNAEGSDDLLSDVDRYKKDNPNSYF
jgi:hypothetical protein